eukprot:4818331-Amphidinium_carterae.1
MASRLHDEIQQLLSQVGRNKSWEKVTLANPLRSWQEKRRGSQDPARQTSSLSSCLMEVNPVKCAEGVQSSSEDKDTKSFPALS